MTDVSKQINSKSALIAELCTRSGLSKKDIESVYDALLDVLKTTLKAGCQVSFPGFGIFAVTTRSARKGRNPSTGEEIDIKESRSVKLKLSSLMKKLLND